MRIKNIITHAPHLGPKEPTPNIPIEMIYTSAYNPIEPSLNEMASNFMAATLRWVSAGLPVVQQEIYDSRMNICGNCEFWDSNARLGLGKCKALGCGCTKLKQWLATEKCPKGKWQF